MKFDNHDIYAAMQQDDVEAYKKLVQSGLTLDYKIKDLTPWPNGADMLDLALWANPEAKVGRYIIENDAENTFGNGIFKKLANSGAALVPLVLEKGYDPKCEQAQELLSNLLKKSAQLQDFNEDTYEAITFLIGAGTSLDKFFDLNGSQREISSFIMSPNFKPYAEILESNNIGILDIQVKGMPIVHKVVESLLGDMARDRMFQHENPELHDPGLIEHTRKSIAKLLGRWRDMGGDFNVLDSDGNTPLHRVMSHAPYQEKEDLDYIIMALVAVDADPRKENTKGESVLDVASGPDMEDALDSVMKAMGRNRIQPRF